MSLIYCPECGHEISANAIACPNCGRPIQPAIPVVEKKVAVATPIRRENGFPAWAFVPIGLLAMILLIVAYIALRQSDETEANTNINVNMAGRHPSTEPSRETRTVDIPPSGSSQPITVPGQTTTVPGTTSAAPVAPAPVTGTVVINAKIVPRRGSAQPARNTKFYLLDKDIESILDEARVEPVEGNSVTSSLGLAAVFPDRFSDFQRAAMRAIAKHVKYTGTTDSGGKAGLREVTPNEYYLFAITQSGQGFALWSSPVSVVNGENVLNLSPQTVTEIEDPNNG
jgi:zinc-ribbon domain